MLDVNDTGVVLLSGIDNSKHVLSLALDAWSVVPFLDPGSQKVWAKTVYFCTNALRAASPSASARVSCSDDFVSYRISLCLPKLLVSMSPRLLKVSRQPANVFGESSAKAETSHAGIPAQGL